MRVGLKTAVQLRLFRNGRPVSGAALVQLRSVLRLTQAELARLLGVHEQTVSNTERGRKNLPQHAEELVRWLAPRAAAVDSERLRDELARGGRWAALSVALADSTPT